METCVNGNDSPPPGVPVIITLPFCSVVPVDKYDTSAAQPKTRSEISTSCRSSPSINVSSRSRDGSPITFARTRHGPIGAKVSNPLEKPHWGTGPAKARSICSLRDEMSLPTVYAAT